MDYDLCKKLKDAGFPQTGVGSNKRIFPDGSIQNYWLAFETKNPGVYIPTLSEMIEQCGDRIHGTSRYKDGILSKGWWTYGTVNIFDSFSTWFEGANLDIAVANLYLALHKQ